ncbi:MAG TPA: hypothetical protein PLV21_07425 [Cyclobacteriaceae bacterium]|nr:hypothetical protein [Cyclobacteriaceae bacterium]HRJ81695.1 hypothetical protein [Cyclobacteriaceae bacterium]
MRGGKRPGAGKKKGSKHARTLLWEQFGRVVLSEGIAKALEELNKLKGEKYLYHFEKFLQYFKPRNLDIGLSIEEPELSDSELDEKIKSLLKHYEQRS